jgi:hypothetical protein
MLPPYSTKKNSEIFSLLIPFSVSIRFTLPFLLHVIILPVPRKSVVSPESSRHGNQFLGSKKLSRYSPCWR